MSNQHADYAYQPLVSYACAFKDYDAVKQDPDLLAHRTAYPRASYYREQLERRKTDLLNDAFR